MHPPTSAADSLRCSLESIEGEFEEIDPSVESIANFLGKDRRATVTIVDDTPSVLGVDTLQRITVDSGGGDLAP